MVGIDHIDDARGEHAVAVTHHFAQKKILNGKMIFAERKRPPHRIKIGPGQRLAQAVQIV